MTDPRWTSETEKLARLAISDPGAFLARGDNYEESIPSWGARAALTALADAGLLIQPDGEVRELWQDYDTVSGGSVTFDSLDEAVEWREKYSEPQVPWDPPPHATVTRVRTVTTWPDGSAQSGPWRTVPDA